MSKQKSSEEASSPRSAEAVVSAHPYAEHYETLKKCLVLLESIPEEMYPGIDDQITDAYNSIDDACSLLSQIINEH